MINVVCAVIQDREGKILACQRPEGKALAGKWEFPGGKVEANEKPELAIVREIKEELACDIQVDRSLPEVEHHYTDFSIRLQPYICRVISGKPTPLEHVALKWISLRNCSALDWAEADVPIWAYLASVGDTFGK